MSSTVDDYDTADRGLRAAAYRARLAVMAAGICSRCDRCGDLVPVCDLGATGEYVRVAGTGGARRERRVCRRCGQPE